jgi:AcrR family transcriptional regulator
MGADGVNTRDRILEMARVMFNEEGATRVSTNHIAAALHMSPGNLHYHFHSRRDIVRAHFEALVVEHAPLWIGIVPGESGILRLIDLWYYGLQIELKYRYFYRDFHSLWREDPGLKDIHSAVFEERRQRVDMFISGCQLRGVLLDSDQTAAVDVNLAVWLLSTMWLSFQDVLDRPATDETLLAGVRLCVRAIEPHVVPDLRESVWRYFAEFSDARLSDPNK